MENCCKQAIADSIKLRTFDMKFCSTCGTKILRECLCQKMIFVDTNYCMFCGRDAKGNRK